MGLLLGQSPSSPATEPQPVQGGAYVEALIGQTIRLNPVLDSTNQIDRDINRLIYSGLLKFDSRGLPHLDLAENYAVSADARLYTFSLRDDAVWHDGTPVTADDVVYTYSKFQDTGYPGREDLHETWEEITIIRLDDKNVQFQLPEPYAPFLDYMATPLLPDHLLRGVSVSELIAHPFNLEPIGTGPFSFQSFTLNDAGGLSGVSLAAFEDYYGQEPFLERVEFRFYNTPQSAWQAYLAGEVQGIGSVPPEILQDALDLPGLNLFTARIPRIGLVFLNTQHPEKTFLGEKSVRQALLLAINRQRVIYEVMEGQGIVANSPILWGNWAYAKDLDVVPYDPLQSISLLEEEGWEAPVGSSPGSEEYVRTREEQTLSFTLLHPPADPYPQIARILERYWRQVGFQVDLEEVEAEVLVEDHLEPRSYQAALTEIDLSRYPDPDPYTFWHDSQVEAGQNYSAFADRNISIWIEQARITPDLTRRADLYRDFQFRFQDQTPSLLLYYPVYSFGISSEIQGTTFGPAYDPSDRFSRITDWYLLARRGFSAAVTSPSRP